MDAFLRSTVLFALSAGVLPGLAYAAAQDSIVPTSKSFSVCQNGEALCLPVTYAGKIYSFLLDTGSALTIFDRDLLHGSPRQVISIDTATGDQQVELFDSPAAFVGTHDLRSGPHVLASDLKMLRGVSGLDIRGVIGMDFLTQHIVQIDFQAGKVTILQSITGDIGTEVPLFQEKEGPTIEVTLPGLGRPERFLVDTGSTNVAHMKTGLLIELDDRMKARRVGQTFTAGLNGVRRNEKWLIDSLSVGGVEETKILATQTDINALGLGFLSQYLVTFDFPNNVMYLKRVRHTGPPLNLDMSGLHILRVNGVTVVHSIDDGSPAAKCGLLPKDVIVQFDGQEVGALTMHCLRRVLCNQGKNVSLQVIRNDHDLLDVKFKLGSLQSQTTGLNPLRTVGCE